MPTADASTPAPTYRMSAISSMPWSVPSSPKGPCSSGSTTSTPPRLSGTDPGAARSSSWPEPPPVADPITTACSVAVTSGSTSARSDHAEGSAETSDHWPDFVMPTGTTS